MRTAVGGELDGIVCNVCESGVSRVLVRKDGRDIYQCDKCGLALVFPQPEMLAEQYDHGYFDLSTYLVYFLYRDRDYRGFSAFEDVNMIGSAQQYWPEADERFFAFKMALNCNGDPWCHEIEQGESGIVPGEPFILSGRIYLDTQSETGPDPGNFLSSFILLYKD